MIFVDLEEPVRNVWDVGDVSGLRLEEGARVRLDGSRELWEVATQIGGRSWDVVLVRRVRRTEVAR